MYLFMWICHLYKLQNFLLLIVGKLVINIQNAFKPKILFNISELNKNIFPQNLIDSCNDHLGTFQNFEKEAIQVL